LEFSGFNINDNDCLTNLVKKLQSEGMPCITNSLAVIIDQNKKATIEECETALAATEIVAALYGNASDELDDELIEQLDRIKTQINIPATVNLQTIAADIIDSLGADSELRDLWNDTEHFEKWQQHLIEIQNRLLK
jgi:Domain of unknown function (DUF4259)